MHSEIHIDTDFLLDQVASLTAVQNNHESWEAFGERIESRRHRVSPSTRCAESAPDKAGSEPVPQASNWQRTKELIHILFVRRRPEHDGIRQRIENLAQFSTASLLSLLSMWVAGILKISIAVTRPMVATILYAVVQFSGDWEILCSPPPKTSLECQSSTLPAVEGNTPRKPEARLSTTLHVHHPMTGSSHHKRLKAIFEANQECHDFPTLDQAFS